MRQPGLAVAIAVALGFPALTACASAGESVTLAPSDREALEQAVAAPSRTAANVARDRYRHPIETLTFFGAKPSQTIIEIWPAGGWYTEILAPYVKSGGGIYYGAGNERMIGGPTRMMAASPDLYGAIRTGGFPAGAGDAKVPDNSADLVLTFRNVHNWMMGDKPFADDAFRQMYAMLKPGGVLGVVEHRLPESANAERERTSGYVKVSTVRRLSEAAGFQFVAASEVNANPKDTADWPEGVWTLPPRNRHEPADREKYLAIGESDRMTLKFVKPAG